MFNYTQDAVQQALSYLRQQATYLEPEIYKVKYPTIRYPDLIPVDTSADAWTPTVTYLSIDGVGQAEWFAAGAKDVPLAEINQQQFETPVKMASIGYRYNLEELARAQKLGINLTSEKGIVARRAAEQFIDQRALYGDNVVGFKGLINNPNVGVIVSTAGSWLAATADQIIADVNQAITGISVATLEIEVANTILLPKSRYDHISSMPRSTTSDTTILDYIRRNNIYTQETGQPLLIRSVRGLETAGTGGTRRMVVYMRSMDVVKMHLPMPYRFLPVWQTGPIVFDVPGIFRFGGVDIRRPDAFRYVDGI
jgi:hypothetical protein